MKSVYVRMPVSSDRLRTATEKKISATATEKKIRIGKLERNLISTALWLEFEENENCNKILKVEKNVSKNCPKS